MLSFRATKVSRIENGRRNDTLKRKGKRIRSLTLTRLIFSTRNPNYYQMQSSIPRTCGAQRGAKGEIFREDVTYLRYLLEKGSYLVKKSVERVTI